MWRRSRSEKTGHQDVYTTPNKSFKVKVDLKSGRDMQILMRNANVEANQQQKQQETEIIAAVGMPKSRLKTEKSKDIKKKTSTINHQNPPNSQKHIWGQMWSNRVRFKGNNWSHSTSKVSECQLSQVKRQYKRVKPLDWANSVCQYC